MFRQTLVVATVALLLAPTEPRAQHNQDHETRATKPYAGQDAREIKSLSPDDVRQLLAGGGWGFAKPAELSSYPGPRHVLDLADKLNLSPEQRREIQVIFDGMNASARKTGAAFVAAERALSKAFENGRLTGDELALHINTTGRLRSALRLIHLEAHLLVRPLLTRHQIMLYEKLRGYGGNSGGNHRGHH